MERAIGSGLAALALAAVLLGAAALARGRSPLPWLRPRATWRRWGGASVTIGVYGLLATVPRVVGAPGSLVQALGWTGLAFLAASIALGAQLRGDPAESDPAA